MKSIFSVFQKGLQKTATTLSRAISGIVSGETAWDKSTYEKIERSLLEADFGAAVSSRLVADIKERYDLGQIKTSEDIFQITRNDIRTFLSKNMKEPKRNKDGPTVILLVGVNGSGKTTTAGKLASLWKNDGAKVMLAACDTYRAAAVEQLKHWGERTECHVVSSVSGADPASVAFDAVQSAVAKKYAVWVIGGTMPMEADDPNKARAACLIYNDKGERVGRYDKVHLFDVNVPGTNEVYRESDSIEPGTESQVFDTPFGKLGIAVCYDLRFPEFFRKMSREGVE